MGMFGAGCIIFVLALSFVGELFVPYGPLEISGGGLVPPNGRHLMGTDDLGRGLHRRYVAHAVDSPFHQGRTICTGH